MNREEKQMEASLDAVLNRLNELKLSITFMIQMLDTEYETINWSTFLDNYGLISSHLTGLAKAISKDNCPPLRHRTVLPLMLSPERDEALVNMTEGRVPVFSHDIVPDYLRTKPDPIAEQKILQNEQKAANITAEAAMKQVTQYNKVVSHIADIISKAREEWDLDSSSRAGIQQTSSMADTHALVAAVGMGKNLKITMPMPGGGPGNMMVPPALRPPTPMSGVNPGAVNQMNKAPAGIKTNIKAAMPIHNYSR
ncbi:mediator of RNA polymerase II transcription subunit 8 [Teleopsis dalmanni]|uniref:mediator of RNA polymerase II transcription subunit 8 n=1 Tax=Teleopsis dalmanni TaxID=139649 RepID=UPI0018CCF5AF|nr:mediator of RNA polymerase II transcription subunit 8 [Teleopsis dalmanni]